MRDKLIWLAAFALILLTFFLCQSCSPKVYGTPSIEHRKTPTQQLTTKDISKGTLFFFLFMGLGFWLDKEVLPK